MRLNPGALLGGRYIVEAELGRGGFATVYAARHAQLGSHHAVKVLHGEMDDEIRGRMLSEGKIQARLTHVNVVRVTDVVALDDGVALVMDRVEGVSLRALLDHGRLSLSSALALAEGILAGVSAAHAAGLIHRDLKPDNVLIDADGTPKISDFGLARAEDPNLRGAHTRQGVGMGTPGYMAPEAFTDVASVDARADIFALGAILYELLSGLRAFPPELSWVQLYKRAGSSDYLPLDQVAPELPGHLVYAVHAALSPSPEDRPVDVTALLALWRGRAVSQVVAALPATDGGVITLEIGVFRLGGAFRVRISGPDPVSSAHGDSQRSSTALDPGALATLLGAPRDYGMELSRQLFWDEAVRARFVELERAAEASGSFLRVCLALEPGDTALHTLRWELLRHPVSGASLASAQRILLSRLVLPREGRAVQLRARSELVARVAGWPVGDAPPPGAVVAELADRLGVPALDPQTALIEGLRAGVDLLFLVGPGGASSGEATFVLEGDPASPIADEGLIARLAELPKAPRLIVLARSPSLASLHAMAVALAVAGVPAVLALPAELSTATLAAMVPALIEELARDGRIDRALSVARARARDRDDAWMPALYCRVRDGLLWYTAGFRGSKSAGSDIWRRLLPPIRAGKVLPILGPGLLAGLHGAPAQIARSLAADKGFPMAAPEWDDLPRVAQFVSVRESRFNLLSTYSGRLLDELLRRHRSWLPPEELPPARKPRLGRLMALVADQLREAEPSDPHRALAALDAAIYVSTTPDPLLERALKAAGRSPQSVNTRWRYKKAPVAADAAELREPSAQSPLVYHAFGAFGSDGEDTLVLTEDDYFDYLIATTAGKLIPRRVESALVNNALLFLGFRLTDWTFRVLFRLMMSLEGKELLKNYRHVAVQLDPELQDMKDIDGAKAYLAEYFGQESNIEIYWGSAEEFLQALHGELAQAGEGAAAEEDEGDDWTF